MDGDVDGDDEYDAKAKFPLDFDFSESVFPSIDRLFY